MSGCELTEITKSFGPIKNRYSIRLSELLKMKIFRELFELATTFAQFQTHVMLIQSALTVSPNQPVTVTFKMRKCVVSTCRQ